MSYACLSVVLIAVSAASQKTSGELPPTESVAVREGPPVGFLTHPCLGKLPPLEDTPANAELANMFVWRTINPAPQTIDEIIVDFAPAAEWLEDVYRGGRIAFPILDTAIHHSNQPWRAELTRKAGENLVNALGEEAGFSSVHSPLFRKSVFHYVDQLIAWIQANDPGRRIRGYVDGAEWFYPGMLDYSELAMAAFRTWLQEKYADLDALNEAWGAQFGAWKDVEPARAKGAGLLDHGLRTYTFGSPIDVGWSSPDAPATPTHVYEVTVQVTPEATPDCLCAFQLVWLDAKNGVARIDSFGPVNGSVISGRATCPDGSEQFRAVLKLAGPGRAAFSSPSVKDLITGRQLLNGSEEGWTLAVWTGHGTGERNAGTQRFTIDTGAPELPFGRTAVALEDWITFSYEAMAEWLNTCALHIKERDPSRLVTSYVGFVFATHSSWDYAMDMQRLDISLANSPAIDVNALQVCAAGNDLTYPACPVDMARKYGKPVWSYDLVDFPYGLHSGFEPIYRASMASIQHGSKAILYCEWNGFPYDYLYSVCIPRVDLNRMLRDVDTAIRMLDGYSLETNVAQLMPLMSYSVADKDGFKGDMLDNGGLYHLILDMGLLPDLYTPYEVGKQGQNCLNNYNILFLPDCPVLPPEVNEAIVAYLDGGGVVVASGRLPEYDLGGDPLTPLLAERVHNGKLLHFATKIGREYWGTVDRIREYGNTPPVLLEAPGCPPDPVARRVLRERVAKALDEASAPWSVRLSLDNGEVHVATYRRDADKAPLVFLVHKGPGRCVGLRITLGETLGDAPWEAWLDFDRTEPVKVDGEGAVAVPDFAHTCVLRPQS